MLSEKQKIIVAFAISNDNKITTKQANEELKKMYFCNHEKYVSEILSRLVNKNVLKRFKRGNYELISMTGFKAAAEQKNQLKLFTK